MCVFFLGGVHRVQGFTAQGFRHIGFQGLGLQCSGLSALQSLLKKRAAVLSCVCSGDLPGPQFPFFLQGYPAVGTGLDAKRAAVFRRLRIFEV